jgi:hypothetical protein
MLEGVLGGLFLTLRRTRPGGLFGIGTIGVNLCDTGHDEPLPNLQFIISDLRFTTHRRQHCLHGTTTISECQQQSQQTAILLLFYKLAFCKVEPLALKNGSLDKKSQWQGRKR